MKLYDKKVVKTFYINPYRIWVLEDGTAYTMLNGDTTLLGKFEFDNNLSKNIEKALKQPLDEGFNHINDVWDYLEKSTDKEDLELKIKEIPEKFGAFTIEIINDGKTARITNDYSEYDTPQTDIVDINFKGDELTEDATQPGNIGTDRISIFGSDAGNELKIKDSNDFYTKLLEVDDFDEEDELYDKREDLINYLNKNTKYQWDANDMYDNCAITESDEDYIEVFIEKDDNDNYIYTVDNSSYNTLEDLVKHMPVLFTDEDEDYDYEDGWEEDNEIDESKENDIYFEYKSKLDDRFHRIPKRTILDILITDRNEAENELGINSKDWEEADDALLKCQRNEAFAYKGLIYDPIDYRLDKLRESANKEYFEIMATNKGMWSGMSTPLRIDGKVLLFTDKDVAEQYLAKLNKEKSVINSFTNYGIQTITVDDNDINNYFVADTLKDIQDIFAVIKQRRDNLDAEMRAERDSLMNELSEKLKESTICKLEPSISNDIIVRIFEPGNDHEYTYRVISVYKKDGFTYKFNDSTYNREEVIDRVIKFVKSYENKFNK